MQDIFRLNQKYQGYVSLIQMTDTHIFPDISQEFDGINTAESMRKVIISAKKTDWPPDSILATGDLVHDPIPASYHQLSNIFNSIDVPIFCLPGNHDNPEVMQRELKGRNIHQIKSIMTKNWLILMLNSWLSNTHAGHLDNIELDFMDRQLNQYPDKFFLICLHHPPVRIGSLWMDQMGLDNPNDFFSVVDNYKQVKGILWGHIHQEFNLKYKQIQLLATPSTCVQFKPATDHYFKDNLAPGYRWLNLYDNGDLQTGIKRI